MQKRGDSLKNILQKGQANIIHAMPWHERKREEPNLCIPPPPPPSLLLDIFTPREKSSPRAKIRSRNRRCCTAPRGNDSVLSPLQIFRYFETILCSLFVRF